jgi:hypothetical protein
MRCGKLRITWSVLCGIACVLLIVAWVRSFSVADTMYIGWRGVPYNAVIVLDPSRLAIELREYDITPGSVANPLIYMRDSQAIPGYQQRRYADGSIPARRWFRFSPRAPTQDATLFIPLWFPTLFLAITGVFPWIQWSKRFSLRTLLIATTLVAVALGLIVALSRWQQVK